MKQIKIRDKEYNCSNKVYYHIQGLESENRLFNMEIKGHEQSELELQKEIERLKQMKLHTEKYASEMENKYIIANNIINELEKYINEEYIYDELGMKIFDASELQDKLQELKGVDKE